MTNAAPATNIKKSPSFERLVAAVRGPAKSKTSPQSDTPAATTGLPTPTEILKALIAFKGDMARDPVYAQDHRRIAVGTHRWGGILRFLQTNNMSPDLFINSHLHLLSSDEQTNALKASALKKDMAKDSIHTKTGVKKAMKQYCDTQGDFPFGELCVVETGEGKKILWRDVGKSAYQGHIRGIPEGTSLRTLAMELFRNDPEYSIRKSKGAKTKISACSAFNSVAWHILQTNETPAPSTDIIDYGSLREKSLSWKDLDVRMKKGEIPGIPDDMGLPVYSAFIHKRIESENLMAPSENELLLS